MSAISDLEMFEALIRATIENAEEVTKNDPPQKQKENQNLLKQLRNSADVLYANLLKRALKEFRSSL